jgi:hypothetical protein
LISRPGLSSFIFAYGINRKKRIFLSKIEALMEFLNGIISYTIFGIKNAGRYSVTFDASNLASGIYIYRIETSSFSSN